MIQKIQQPIVAYILVAAIFLMDTFFAYTSIEWILYLIPIMGIASFLGNRHFYIITGLCIFLTAIDHFISPLPDLTFDQIDLNNREIGIVVLVVASVLHRFRINLALQSESKDELQWALKAADDRAYILDSLMNYLPMGVVYAEGKNPVIKMASKTFSDFVHLPLPQVQGKRVEPTSWNMRLAGRDTQTTYKDLPVYRAINSSQVIKDEEWIIGSDGKQNIYSVNSGPVKDTKGKIIGAISSWSDITERKQREIEREQLIRDLESEKQEISESEEKLKEITENVPDFFWTARPNGEFDYFSTDLIEFMEMPVEEVMAQWVSRIHPDDQQKVMLARDLSLKTGLIFKMEYRVLKKSENQYYWFRATAIPIRNKQNEITHWFGVSTNIDDLKTVQLRLNSLLKERSFQKNFLKTLINSIPVGIAVVRCPDYIYEIVNPNFCKIPGHKDLRLLGTKLSKTVSPTEQWVNPQWLNEVCETKNTLSKHEFEAHLGDKGEISYWNFDTIPLDIANENVSRILILAVNVTEFVVARKQMEQENARYQALVNNMTDGLVIAEPNGAILHDNPVAARLHGFDVTHKSIKHAEEYPNVFEFYDLEGTLLPLEQWPLVRALNGQKFTGAEFHVHRKDTGKKWFGNFSGTPVYDTAGTHIMSIVTIRDVTESHKKEREAEEKKNILDAMMNYLPLGVMHVSMPDLTIKATSSYDRQLTGEWAGKNLMNRIGETRFYQTDDKRSSDFHNYPLYRVIEKKIIIQNEEWNYGVIQGKYLNVSVSGCPLFDSKGEITGAIMIWLDITEQVHIRKVIESEAAKYRGIFNNLGEGLLVVGAGNVVQETNHSLREMFNISENDWRLPAAQYQNNFKLYNMQENELPFESWPIPRALRGESVSQERFHIKNMHSGKDWHAIVSATSVYDNDNNFLLAMATYTDITSQISSEIQLRNERNFISTILETQGALVVVLDKEGRITRFNHACEKITGFIFEEVEGRKIRDVFILPDEIETTKDQLKKLYSGTSPVDFENYWISKTDEKHFIRWRCTGLKGKKNGVEMVICTGIDITDRMRSEQKIKEINTELQTANSDLEAFSSSVSHDLRAPLNTIDGFTSIIEEDYANCFDEAGRKYFSSIKSSVKKMQQLIDDLLKLSRISKTGMLKETVNLCDMVDETIRDVTSSEPDRKTEIIVQKHVPVKADRSLLHIAVENIIRNAWKFTSKNEITKIEFAALHQNGKVVYMVRDNGAGFDMANADKLFTPFKRLHSEKEFSGTGIGLAIVQRIIQKHGGRIWAEGEIGKGAAFYFTLGEE